jgi:hypothetical protein
MLEDVGALLPIALGLRRAGAGAATPASRIGAVLMVLLVAVVVVPQLLLSKALSAHISKCSGKRYQIPSRLAGRVVSEQLPE